MTSPVLIRSQPGIKRDGTELEGDFYVDGQWVRFQRGLPRKIGGYKSITRDLSVNARTLHSQLRNRYEYIHAGGAIGIERVQYSLDGPGATIVDRTPVAFVADSHNYWSLDAMYDSSSNKLNLFALLSNGCPCSTDTPGILYSGDLYATTALTTVTGVAASSGIVAVPPYLLAYGSDGYVQWSRPNMPNDFTGSGSGEVRVTSQKILKALPLRGGGGYTPAVLMWSVDSLIRGMYSGGTTQWEWDNLTAQSSVLSPAGIIENDGIFYWPGADRFLMFNGVVREIPNQLNVNWFFDNINYTSRCFAMKNPRWGEIWWCFPFGEDEAECTHAVIYNYRENTWYDTVLPNGGRGSGIYNASEVGALMTGNQLNSNSKYTLWNHEKGVDEIDGTDQRAIQSYFETSDMFMGSADKPSNDGLSVEVIEPDFVQTGDMTVYVKGRANARAPMKVLEQHTFGDTPATPYEQIVPTKSTARQLRFRFESNVLGGDYQMGEVVGQIQPSTGKLL